QSPHLVGNGYAHEFDASNHACDCRSSHGGGQAHYSDSYYSRMHHIAVDDYVVDVLMPDLAGHERSPASFLVYLALWTSLYRSEERSITLSLQDLVTQTGLSKSSVQVALRILKRRALIAVTRTSPTSVPCYTLIRHWVKRRVPSRSPRPQHPA